MYFPRKQLRIFVKNGKIYARSGSSFDHYMQKEVML